MLNLEPLSAVYRAISLPLPEIRSVDADAIPEPYRRLLVHDEDMTPTLEAAYATRIHLRRIHHGIHESLLNRLVVLELDGSQQAVEVGAIRIYLDRLPEAARAAVLGFYQPFGSILRDHGIRHQSHPDGYFAVTPDHLIRRVLAANGEPALYGRSNTLRYPDGAVLAEVIEILPPRGPAGSL